MITREQMKETLHAICADVRSEAAWLNTVSYLEFIGARKISRTVAKHHPTLEILEHLSDETRHAHEFKRLAVELIGEPTYLALEPARKMFMVLDQQLTEWVRGNVGDDENLMYLLVTTLIERRAMQIYPLYRSETGHEIVRESLSQIVTEEQAHRVALEEACVERLQHFGFDLEFAIAIEERAFSDFWKELDTYFDIDVD